jgi:uncharacterized protein YukE
MERLKPKVKEEDEVVIEHFASEVKRMRTGASQLHASSNALRASMKKRAEERRGEATRRMQGRVAQLKKEFEAVTEKLKESNKRRIAHIWGSHKPGTRVADII